MEGRGEDLHSPLQSRSFERHLGQRACGWLGAAGRGLNWRTEESRRHFFTVQGVIASSKQFILNLSDLSRILKNSILTSEYKREVEQ